MMREIGIFDALDGAWDRMIKILFKPFDFYKWLVVAFAAWLASLGDSGASFNFNLKLPNFGKTPPGPGPSGNAPFSLPDFSSWNWERVSAHFKNVAPWIIVAIVVGVLICILLLIIFSLLLAWIKARGEFIFIDNLVHNRPKIVAPWKEFKSEGNSLFIFRLVLMFLFGFLLLFSVAASGLLTFSWIKACATSRTIIMPHATAISGIILLAISMSVILLIGTCLNVLINDFMLPIMYKQGVMSFEAFQTVFRIVLDFPWQIFKYFLTIIIMKLATSLLIFICCLLTCCVGFIVLSIPYVWALLTLPLLIFFRLFSIEYLSLFGDEFDLRDPEMITE